MNKYKYYYILLIHIPFKEININAIYGVQVKHILQTSRGELHKIYIAVGRVEYGVDLCSVNRILC